MRLEVQNAINLLDDVGVWAISPSMIHDYLVNQKGFEVSKDEVMICIDELSASDFIVWDATKAYVRPVLYVNNP